MSGLWFSIYDFSFEYKGNEPSYFNPSDFAWSKEIEDAYPQIKQELEEFLAKENLVSYFNNSMLEKENSWKTISLRTWGIEHFKNQNKFPVLAKLIAAHPDILSAAFSKLEPDSIIKPHCGDTNAIVRCHLGISVPGGLPACGFSVKGVEREWKNGEWLFFLDAYNHQAWNRTDQPRYILIIDALRPEFKKKKWYVCSTVMTSLFLQRRAEKYHVNMFRFPPLTYSIARMLQPLSLLKSGLANIFKVY